MKTATGWCLTGLGLCLLLGGCGDEPRQANTDGVTGDTEHEANQAMAALEARAAAIEARLDAMTAAAAGHGRGAYAGGGGLVVGGQGSTSLLEDLAQLRRQLSEMQATDRERIGRVRELGAQLTATRSELERARGELAIMRTAGPDAEVARAELADLQNRFNDLLEAHRSAEARRLTIEQHYFALAAATLRLRPLETQALLELQRSLRDDLGAVEPTDLASRSQDDDSAGRGP